VGSPGSPSWILSPAARSLEDSEPRTSPANSEDNYTALALRPAPEPSPARPVAPAPARPLALSALSSNPAFPFLLDAPGSSPETIGSSSSSGGGSGGGSGAAAAATGLPSPTVSFRDFFGEETLTCGLGSLMRADAASLERAASSLSTTVLVATAKSSGVLSPTLSKRRPATALPAITESPLALRRAAPATTAAAQAVPSPAGGRLAAVRTSGARLPGALSVGTGGRAAGPSPLPPPGLPHVLSPHGESRIRGAPPARSADPSPSAGLSRASRGSNRG
jgi:hypothetical protein